MNRLPIHALSREEQQKLLGQIYALMSKQVQSYHKHRHMGSNSSVPVELAQELMASILYTVDQAGGVSVHRSAEEALMLGQTLLESKLTKARSLLELVNGTGPRWQTECRWEALRYLRHYLDHYDPLHLAHKGPDGLFYPIPVSPPEDIRGIDSCLFYLNILWIENQIMAGVPEDALEQFLDRLPDSALNPCEQLLANGMGKALLGAGISQLVFEEEARARLAALLVGATAESLKAAAGLLCQWLDLKDENARMYVEAAAAQLAPWTGGNTHSANWENIFL